MQRNIQRNIHFQISVINSIVGNLYLVYILDAILNFLQGSMMACVHHFDSVIPVSIQEEAQTCADPEIFMRGGPTKMVIFCHRRGGWGGPTPQKSRNNLFLGKNFQIPGEVRTPAPPPSGSAHVKYVYCINIW